ncbi:15'-oxygenase (ACO) (8'-apo-beta-carotenal 15, partial [Durusdinium trenchii]
MGDRSAKSRPGDREGWEVAEADFEAWKVTVADEGVPRRELAPSWGSVPASVVGRFLRNGPAKFERGETKMRLLDGDGMIFMVEFCPDGRVFASGRFVETPMFQEERAAKASLFRGAFGTPSTRTLDNFGIPKFKNVANTHTLLHGGRLFALWEGGLPCEMEPGSLETIGLSTIEGAVKRGESFSAHPCADMLSGNLVNVGSNPARNARNVVDKDHLIVWEFDPALKILSKQLVPLELPFTFMHDFCITANFVVFLQCPLKQSFWKVVAGYGVGSAISDSGGRDAFVYVVRRQQTGKCDGSKGRPEMAVFRTHRLFSYHTVNAFERDDGQLVFDILSSRQYRSLDEASDSRPLAREPFAAVGPDQSYDVRMERLVMDPSLVAPCVVEMPIHELTERRVLLGEPLQRELGLEMPALHPAYYSVRHRFVYAVHMQGVVHGVNRAWSGVLKFDCDTGTHKSWFADERRTLICEPRFVPSLEQASEDDGHLLFLAFDPTTRTSSMHILNALDMTLTCVIPLQALAKRSGIARREADR